MADTPLQPASAGANDAPRAFSTDRRALLAAIPAVAVAASIPAGAAATVPSARWEALKAAYQSATADFDAISAQHTMADRMASEFYGAGPTREIRYTSPGFTRGPLTMAAHETTHTLSLRDIKDPPVGLEQHPDFLAYRAEAEAWVNQREEHLRRTGLREREADQVTSSRRQRAAWRAMVSYPVTTLAELHEKLETANSYADDLEEHVELLKHIAADVRRLAGETA